MEMCYNNELVMPKSFVVVNEEEMTYVEGGGHYTVSISAKMCGDIAAGYAGAAAVSQLLNFIPGGGNIAAAICGAYFGVLSSYFWLGSNHNGMTLHIYTVGKVLISAVPVIKW